MHTHTSASPDSQTDPRELIERALEVGLSRLAITDHNTIAGALAAKAIASEMGMADFVIVGEEIEVDTGGELIAYYLSKEVPPSLSVEETIRRLRAQGAVISVSHPLDRIRKSAMGADRTGEIIDQVDALEGFNARCLLGADNRRAQALAAKHGKCLTAGSDAHIVSEVGSGYVSVPPFIDDAKAFLESLGKAHVNGRLSGIVPHFASTMAKFRK